MSPRRAAGWFAVAFWTLFGAVSGFQVWISMILHGHSVPRLIGYHVAVWEGWLLATAAIVWLARRWPVVPPRRLEILVHVLASCVIAVLHSFYWLALLIALRPYDKMSAEPSQLNVAQILFARLPLEWLLYLFVLGCALAFDFYERFRERELKTAQLETSLADARLHALQLQIQPHFLFNTMNAISSLVRNRRNDEAVTMMASLSDLLRYALDHAGDQQVALEEESEVLRRYLEIQHTRFSDRMSFSITIPADAGRGAVPVFLLQPIAENAVRHGIAVSATPGVVDVRAFRDGDRLHVDVFNSGTLGDAFETGVGLRNTRERLHHIYGDRARFDLANANGGVLASLSIPWREVA